MSEILNGLCNKVYDDIDVFVRALKRLLEISEIDYKEINNIYDKTENCQTQEEYIKATLCHPKMKLLVENIASIYLKLPKEEQVNRKIFLQDIEPLFYSKIIQKDKIFLEINKKINLSNNEIDKKLFRILLFQSVDYVEFAPYYRGANSLVNSILQNQLKIYINTDAFEDLTNFVRFIILLQEYNILDLKKYRVRQKNPASKWKNANDIIKPRLNINDFENFFKFGVYRKNVNDIIKKVNRNINEENYKEEIFEKSNQEVKEIINKLISL